MKKNKMHLAAGLAALLGVGQALAVEVTIPDGNPGAGFGGGPFGIASEDQETEPGTVPGQSWDLEGFYVVGTTLYIVSGYNLEAGDATYKPGDLFIKVGGGSPGYAPLGSAGIVTDASQGYGYTHVVDTSVNPGSFGATATYYTVSGASSYQTTVNDYLGANPWRYHSGATGSGSTAIGYDATNTDLDVTSIGSSAIGGNHHVLAINLGFLGSVAPGTPVYLSYTMECGNDSLKGKYVGGFDVPDAGASMLLMLLGAGGLLGYRSRFASAK